jgi:hypothetical protein
MTATPASGPAEADHVVTSSGMAVKVTLAGQESQ